MLVKLLVVLVVLLLLAAYLIYVERRLLGFMQLRLGPNRAGPQGLLQPVADAVKLLTKEDFIPAEPTGSFSSMPRRWWPPRRCSSSPWSPLPRAGPSGASESPG